MNSIYIDTSQLTKGAERFKNMSVELDQAVDDVLNKNAVEMSEKAHQNAATQGLSYKNFLIPHIQPDVSQHLRKLVTVNAFYAAYVEFGTGAYAAAYASSLPADWQLFAAQFRGKIGGTFAEMLTSLREWVRLKGIASGKEIDSVAYLIARSILIHGVKPHPFLYPAYVAQLPQLQADLNNALKAVI